MAAFALSICTKNIMQETYLMYTMQNKSLCWTWCVVVLQEPPVLPGLVQQQLQQLAASSRVGAALVILQWLLLVAERIRQMPAAAAAADAAAAVATTSVALAAQVASRVPEQLPDSCLVYLGAPGPSLPSLPATEPYTELAASYGQMRRELYRLMNLCLEVRATSF